MSCVLGYILLILTRKWKLLTKCCPRTDNLDLRNFFNWKFVVFLLRKSYYSREILFMHHIPRNVLVPGIFSPSQRNFRGPKGSWRLQGFSRVQENYGGPRGSLELQWSWWVSGFHFWNRSKACTPIENHLTIKLKHQIRLIILNKKQSKWK